MIHEHLAGAFGRLFEQWSGKKAEQIQPIQSASASRRQYFRVQAGDIRAIAAFYSNPLENNAFVYLSDHFRSRGLRVPEVYAYLPGENIYLQEDLGDQTLYQLIGQGGFPFQKAIELLAELQIRGQEGLDYSFCTTRVVFDAPAMQWDLNYFKYYFLKLLDIPFEEEALDRDFHRLAGVLEQAQPLFFMHRDFQSRNILIHQGEYYAIDYQSGRKGALAYDLASLLWQAKANLPHETRESLLGYYLEVAGQLTDLDGERFRSEYYGFVLLRSLQVLGAYGLRGIVEKKPHFVESIPYAIENLRWLRDHAPLPTDIPALWEALDRYAGIEKEQAPAAGAALKVLVQSFSYKKGLPADTEGHGGGFIFDCRAIHNPGRYAEYKHLTGKDPAVAQFLQQEPAMSDFLEDATRMVGKSVETYLERGFDSLSVSFGCTGGQHRSVYAAERMADFLRTRYGVEVTLRHREQEGLV